MLLYSIPDLDTTFTCHIGLERIDGEYVWIDGNTSGYRKWGTLSDTQPLSTTTRPTFNCVRHKYRVGGVLSQGWANAGCTESRNCYFCSKSGKQARMLARATRIVIHSIFVLGPLALGK